MSEKAQKRFLLMAVLVLGVGATVWFWFYQRESSPSPNEERGLVSQQAPRTEGVRASNENSIAKVEDDASELEHSQSESNNRGTEVKLASDFRTAPDALAAEQVILQAEGFGLAVASDWRMQLDAACNSDDLAYVSEAANAVQELYVEQLLAYCDGYTPSQDFSNPAYPQDVTDALLGLDRSQSKDEFADNLASASVSETNKVIVDWLRSANSPEQLLAAGDYLSEYYQSAGEPLWQPDIDDMNISESVVSGLQFSALELYSCQRFGGCGPNSLRTIRTCAYASGCQPGWNYRQYVFANSSPLEMDYIQLLLQHIHRTDGAP